MYLPQHRLVYGLFHNHNTDSSPLFIKLLLYNLLNELVLPQIGPLNAYELIPNPLGFLVDYTPLQLLFNFLELFRNFYQVTLFHILIIFCPFFQLFLNGFPY